MASTGFNSSTPHQNFPSSVGKPTPMAAPINESYRSHEKFLTPNQREVEDSLELGVNVISRGMQPRNNPHQTVATRFEDTATPEDGKEATN